LLSGADRASISSLGVAECRRVLGPECSDSDEEILANRDRLAALAHALLDLAEERER
jgi:hypothetical protein